MQRVIVGLSGNNQTKIFVLYNPPKPYESLRQEPRTLDPKP